MGVVWIFSTSTPLFSHSEMPVGQTHLYKQIKPAWLNWAISLESSTLMGDDRLISHPSPRGTQESFIQGGSAPRSRPYPFLL